MGFWFLYQNWTRFERALSGRLGTTLQRKTAEFSLCGAEDPNQISTVECIVSCPCWQLRPLVNRPPPTAAHIENWVVVLDRDMVQSPLRQFGMTTVRDLIQIRFGFAAGSRQQQPEAQLANRQRASRLSGRGQVRAGAELFRVSHNHHDARMPEGGATPCAQTGIDPA